MIQIHIIHKYIWTVNTDFLRIKFFLVRFFQVVTYPYLQKSYIHLCDATEQHNKII